MRDEDQPHDPSRRHALECMIWAGTGVLWTVSGGVPKSLGLLAQPKRRKPPKAPSLLCKSPTVTSASTRRPIPTPSRP